MRRTGKGLGDDNSPFMVRLRNVVRRFTVKTSSGIKWAIEGYKNGDETEDDSAEVWSNIGFQSRPPATAARVRPEVIIVRPGANSNNSAIIATRDHDTLKAVFVAMGLDDLAADEVMLYNSSSHIRVLADGTIEAKTHDGTAVTLARSDHKHSVTTTATVSTGSAGVVTMGVSDSNTTKLKGE